METGETTDRQAVLDELEAVLGSTDFDASDRNRDFLKYVVDETLEGRGHRIKAYSVATTVFGRAADFDPSLDSIVRIEAGRLRRSLERYYLTGGSGNSLRIRIPKGTYTPDFEVSETDITDGEAGTLTPSPVGPSILVRAFAEEGDTALHPGFAKGLVRHLIIGLARFTGIHVYGPGNVARCEERAEQGAPARKEPDYLLSGVTDLRADRFSIEVFLEDAATHEIVWAEVFVRNCDPSNVTKLRGRVADEIACSIAQPFGVLFCRRAEEVERREAQGQDALDCVTRFHMYSRPFDPVSHESVRQCLEAAVRKYPNFADAHAYLAQVCVNDFWYGFRKSQDGAGLYRAQELANRSIALAPRSSHGYFALGQVYWCLGDTNGAVEAFELGLRRNPNDTSILGDLGLCHALQMNWETAAAMITEACRLNPVQASVCRIGTALYHYWEGRLDLALSEARKAGDASYMFGPLLIAAVASKLRLKQDVERAIASLRKTGVDSLSMLIHELRLRGLHPDLISRLVNDIQTSDFAFGHGLKSTA
ncbi:hypothetical protein KHP62_13430 [Rhodobacteraceae bacterium NNCM2]|nr:hypothetical protein [Coraliihabitans acroporae]